MANEKTEKSDITPPNPIPTTATTLLDKLELDISDMNSTQIDNKTDTNRQAPLTRDEVLKLLEEGLRIAQYKLHGGRIKDVELEKCKQNWARVLASLATVYLNGLETKQLDELAKRITDIEQGQIEKYMTDLKKQSAEQIKAAQEHMAQQDAEIQELKKQAHEIEKQSAELDKKTAEVVELAEQSKKKEKKMETDISKSYV